MNKLTYVLLILVVATFGLSFGQKQRSSISVNQGTDSKDRVDRAKAAKQHFPVAEFDEPEISDPARSLARKEKQKRHNNFRFVPKNPQPWQAESVFVPEGNFNFSALPVSESELILVGRVSEGAAHLSEDKMNVFSEFSVVVSSVLKTDKKEVTEGTVITVERIGGHVKYPNGRKLLFRISGWNMPKVGVDYLFFLTSKNKVDWEILTAYEISGTQLFPLDESAQFEELSGTALSSALQRIHAATSQKPLN